MFIKTMFLIIAVTSANAVHLKSAAQAPLDGNKYVGQLFKTAESVDKIAKACLAGLTTSIPTPFCWKQAKQLGSDCGNIEMMSCGPAACS
jgi:hypothetical protein